MYKKNILQRNRKADAFSGISGILGVLVPIFLVMVVTRNMGQKKALLVGTYGGIIGAVALFLLLRVGDPTLVNFSSMNLYTIAFIVFYITMSGFGGLSSSIVIPMTADCADYEVYRSGRYVPGLMGTLFSFIDKMISSFATTIIGWILNLVAMKSYPLSKEMMASIQERITQIKQEAQNN